MECLEEVGSSRRSVWHLTDLSHSVFRESAFDPGAAALPQGVGVGGAIFEGDLEDDEGTFETCFLWLGTVKALARLQE